jgi:hypothetical protein
MTKYATMELGIIWKCWERAKVQGELMRVVGARRNEEGNDGKGKSILPLHFNPGVGISSQV